MNYITVSEAAEKWGVSKSLVRRYLAQNRIPKAKCNDGIWSILETAKKPPKLPNTPVENKELCTLASKLVNQKKKRNYHGVQFKLRRARNKEWYPRGGEPWTKDEETHMVSLYRSGCNIYQIANILKRTPVAISDRIKKFQNRPIYRSHK